MPGGDGPDHDATKIAREADSTTTASAPGFRAVLVGVSVDVRSQPVFVRVPGEPFRTTRRWTSSAAWSQIANDHVAHGRRVARPCAAAEESGMRLHPPERLEDSAPSKGRRPHAAHDFAFPNTLKANQPELRAKVATHSNERLRSPDDR